MGDLYDAIAPIRKSLLAIAAYIFLKIACAIARPSTSTATSVKAFGSLLNFRTKALLQHYSRPESFKSWRNPVTFNTSPNFLSQILQVFQPLNRADGIGEFPPNTLNSLPSQPQSDSSSVERLRRIIFACKADNFL